MLKIDFVDFWPALVKTDNYFFHLLSTKYDVVIDESSPDLVICSCYSMNKVRYYDKCKMVFFSGENHGDYSVNGDRWVAPDIKYDLSLTQSTIVGTNLPLFVLFLNWFNIPTIESRDISHHIELDSLLRAPSNIDEIMQKKSEICSFIVGNPTSTDRIEFCKYVAQRMPVRCPGRVQNNTHPIGGRGDTKHKVDYLEQFYLNIAFENSKNDGYITEKILHPMAANCIPIYKGSENVGQYFHEQTFINGNFEYYIVFMEMEKISKDKELFAHMINQPKMKQSVIDEFSPAKVLEHFDKIL